MATTHKIYNNIDRLIINGKVNMIEFYRKRYTESEMWRPSFEAPGPDGYTMSFFKVRWATLKENLMQPIQNFHQNEMFEKSFNATFIALIPKKYGAEERKDFRPIRLIGGVYKIIAKLLTERMKTVMGELIDEHQIF
ncbi:hypothetical protein MTR67_048342 [Solanum verrucosum]|uniref:Reverse transcriptase domain-containing protein n=1 Tax=Solanum verrucosum TaxID=315347 RepID=A0AAF0UYQ2_SOLVR|nr:hypothetical protein MTR67_048342 [Solanum verrucosum]